MLESAGSWSRGPSQPPSHGPFSLLAHRPGSPLDSTGSESAEGTGESRTGRSADAGGDQTLHRGLPQRVAEAPQAPPGLEDPGRAAFPSHALANARALHEAPQFDHEAWMPGSAVVGAAAVAGA